MHLYKSERPVHGESIVMRPSSTFWRYIWPVWLLVSEGIAGLPLGEFLCFMRCALVGSYKSGECHRRSNILWG